MTSNLSRLLAALGALVLPTLCLVIGPLDWAVDAHAEMVGSVPPGGGGVPTPLPQARPDFAQLPPGLPEASAPGLGGWDAGSAVTTAPTVLLHGRALTRCDAYQASSGTLEGMGHAVTGWIPFGVSEPAGRAAGTAGTTVAADLERPAAATRSDDVEQRPAPVDGADRTPAEGRRWDTLSAVGGLGAVSVAVAVALLRRAGNVGSED